MKRIVFSSTITSSFTPCVTTCTITLGSILILITKAIGPNLLLCGTPPVTLTKSDASLPNCVKWDRSFKYDANHLIRTDLTTISFMFSNSLLWSIRSKALPKSRKTILITLCISSIDLCHLCIKLTEEFRPILTHFRVILS